MLNSEGVFKGIVSADSLREVIEADKLISDAYLDDVVTANEADSMQDILPQVASHGWAIPVLDEHGEYKGAVSKNLFLRTLHRSQDEQNERVSESNGEK